MKKTNCKHIVQLQLCLPTTTRPHAQANKFRKILTNSNSTDIGSIVKTDNTFTTSPVEMERDQLESHFPRCRFVQDDTRKEINYNTTTFNWQYAEKVYIIKRTVTHTKLPAKMEFSPISYKGAAIHRSTT